MYVCVGVGGVGVGVDACVCVCVCVCAHEYKALIHLNMYSLIAFVIVLGVGCMGLLMAERDNLKVGMGYDGYLFMLD